MDTVMTQLYSVRNMQHSLTTVNLVISARQSDIMLEHAPFMSFCFLIVFATRKWPFHGF